jgi:8-oxo-dGTP pyrophosphatase MutT (NUDIX family)
LVLREFIVGPGAAGAGLAYGRPPVEPRAAATVALLRDGPSGPEVFLMRRMTSMAFAPSMHVFPGGGVDPGDLADNVPWAGPSPQTWGERLGVSPAAAAGLVRAAVRETFEECGVLLAAPDARLDPGLDPGPEGAVADLTDPSWEADRKGLVARELTLATVLRRRGLVLRSDLLAPWSRWCTPAFEPRRYDTWFFLARLPAGQRARELGGEADHAAWWLAADAVSGADGGTDQAGSPAMMPPTVVTVEEVAAAPDVAGLLATPRALRRVMPWRVRTGDGGSVVQVDLDGRGGGEPGPASGIEGAVVREQR